MFSAKEKEIIVTQIASILIMGIYALYVYQDKIADNPEIINNLKFWGTTFLIFLPIAIVSLIIIHIIFAIINKIVTNEEIPSKSDEMDKLIELKSLRISHWIFSLGFILAMASQAFEMEPYVMFLTLICSGLLSGLVEGMAQLYFYRKGV